VECGGVIGQWEIGDVPFVEHRKFFPECPVVCQSDLSNEDIGIQVRTPKYPEYSTIESRNRSFSSWTSTVQDSTVLAQAGFYYLGSGDEVMHTTPLLLRHNLCINRYVKFVFEGSLFLL